MPAQLPANTAYTYATEFSVDEAQQAGATGVWFSQPVAGYVENFLHFPVGGDVPSGYYDKTKAAWIAEPSGRVVKLLGVSNGKADLDVTGGGQPASQATLDALGITDAERVKLASLYQPGAELLRVPLEHFSPGDWNWPFTLPDLTEGPKNPSPPPPVTGGYGPPPNNCGSTIGCENQTLGEKVS